MYVTLFFVTSWMGLQSDEPRWFVWTDRMNPGGSTEIDALMSGLESAPIDGLGVVGWGVGGIEAEAVMLGQPVYMLMPEVIGFKLMGNLPVARQWPARQAYLHLHWSRGAASGKRSRCRRIVKTNSG